jgi:hypothetical protein
MNLREIYSARQRKQGRVDVCSGLVLLAAPVSFLRRAGRRYLTLGIELTEHAFQLYVAVGNLRLVRIVEFYRLAQREEVLSTEVSRQRPAADLLEAVEPADWLLIRVGWYGYDVKCRPDVDASSMPMHNRESPGFALPLTLCRRHFSSQRISPEGGIAE